MKYCRILVCNDIYCVLMEPGNWLRDPLFSVAQQGRYLVSERALRSHRDKACPGEDNPRT